MKSAASSKHAVPAFPMNGQQDWKSRCRPTPAVGSAPRAATGASTVAGTTRPLAFSGTGALAECLGVPWQKLFRSPKLCLRDLALVEPLTVGFHAVDRGRVSASDTALILGCGAIGLGAIAGAAFRKARVIAVDIDHAKLATARRCGAAETINSKAEPLHERVHALTDGHGPDVVIEAVGMPQTFRAAVEEACFAGRVVYIGYAKAPVEFETRLFVQKELDIMGSRNATPADFEAVIRLLETGAFPVEMRGHPRLHPRSGRECVERVGSQPELGDQDPGLLGLKTRHSEPRRRIGALASHQGLTAIALKKE